MLLHLLDRMLRKRLRSRVVFRVSDHGRFPSVPSREAGSLAELSPEAGRWTSGHAPDAGSVGRGTGLAAISVRTRLGPLAPGSSRLITIPECGY